ncbi:MAG: hypothetical protein ACP5OG_04140 [Candidatus Nanoarchaeia archaeon]
MKIKIQENINSNKDLSRIVKSTLDYSKLTNPYCTSKISNKFNSYKEFYRFLWNNLQTSAEDFYQLVKKNSKILLENKHNIKKIIDSLYGNRLSRPSKDIIEELIRKKISKDSLSKEVFPNEHISYPELYHGTGSRALFSILNSGKLYSESRLYDLATKVQTGERYKQNKPWRNDLISLTMSGRIALDPHAFIDGISHFNDFPVVFGFSDNAIHRATNGSGTRFNDYDQEPGEVCVKDKLPIEACTHLFIPNKKINKLMDLVDKYEFKVLPIEALQARLMYLSLDSHLGEN